MYKIDVSLDDNSYGIFIKKGIFQSIAEHIFRVDKYSKIFIISQKSIIDIYNPHFLLAEDILCIEENEAGKTLNEAHRIIKVLIEKECNRSSLIIGLGGGVVTDFTGFISSIFMRGVDHILIPTSLLAMVDASIGGKTALNTSDSKNTIGTIKQPKAVYIDPLLLKTLPVKEVINGFAEMLKYGLINDKSLFDLLIENRQNIIDLNNMDLIESVIIKCCQSKSRIIEKDQFDLNERLKLNFGHTIGHAIEAHYNYQSISHGDAVYYGMIAASYISNKKGYLSDEDFNHICSQIHLIPKHKLNNVGDEDIFHYIKYDKKNKGNKLQFILLNNIGSAFIDDSVTNTEIKESIRYILQ